MNLKRKRTAGAVTSAAGCAALWAGYLLSAGKTSHYLGGLIVMLAAVALYFFDVFMNGRDWLDLQCVFTGSWLFTIGMAALRLCRYQKIWEGKTWALFAGALVAFGRDQRGGTAAGGWPYFSPGRCAADAAGVLLWPRVRGGLYWKSVVRQHRAGGAAVRTATGGQSAGGRTLPAAAAKGGNGQESACGFCTR